MRRPLITLAVFCALTSCARASLELSISTPDDLANLTVGQSVEFDVSLSGLAAGDQLGYLAASVTFDSTLFGAPTSVSPGAIIPDPTGFITDAIPSPGLADGIYDFTFASTSAPISSNGAFFSFTVAVQSVQQPTSGSVGIDPNSLAASDGNNVPLATSSLEAGAPISYQDVLPENPNPTTVPGPASWVLLLTGAGGAGVGAFFKKISRRAQ